MQHSLVDKPTSLSIRVFPGGFSLFVYGEKNHLTSQKTLLTDLLNANYAKILDRQPEINRPYKKLAVVCETNFFTIVPDVFNEPSGYRNLLHLHYPAVDEQWGIFYERIPGALLIYALPRQFIQNLQSRLPEAGFYLHLMNPLKKGLETNGDFLLVYLREKKTDCIVISKKSLLYYNSFDYESAEDVVYHVLHLTDQFQLNPERLRIQMIGDQEKVRPDHILGAYLPNVTFSPLTVEYENYQW